MEGITAAKYTRIATGEVMEAIRWTQNNTRAIAEFAGKTLLGEENGKLVFAGVPNSAQVRVGYGEWIVRWPSGAVFAMANAMFQYSFEINH